MSPSLRSLAAVALGLGFAACGSKSGLSLGFDAGAPPDAAPDAPNDAGGDVGAHDTSADAADAPAEDALPPIDANVLDVVKPNNCADAAITLVYLFSSDGKLLSFDPATLAIATIGTVACPTQLSPNSMAVDHLGVAYANFTTGEAGEIWKLSTATAKCTPTPYVPKLGFQRFGMGFLGDQDGGEELYITKSDGAGALARVALPSFELDFKGDFSPPLSLCELTSRGDGQLFALCMKNNGATLAQVDPETAQVIGVDNLKVGNPTSAFAFAFWGGKFWIFTGNQGVGSTVTEYDPALKKETPVLSTKEVIVGAGVSTCAPID